MLGGAGGAPGLARLLSRAEHAEAIGLHSVWLPEAHFRPGAMASPLVVLAAIAARTRRLRLGTTSLLLTVPHPLRIAREAAALDVLSDGRLFLGLGRGFAPPLFRAFGIDAATKRDRFDEALDAMLAAWRGEPVRLDGAHFGARGDLDVRSTALPRQRPHPPLLVAAFGRRALEQAAARGLAWLASPLEPLLILEQNLAIHRAALGERPLAGPFRVPVMRTLHVAETDLEAARVWASLEAEAEIARRAPQGSIARAAAAPLGERVLVGTRHEVADALGRLRERIGLDLLIVRSETAGADEPQQRRSLERLVSDVLPTLRS